MLCATSANNNYPSTSLVAFAITSAAYVYGRSILQKAKSKFIGLLRNRVADNDIIILSPPSQAASQTTTSQILLIIFPGALIEASEYVPIAKVVQDEALSQNITVTVGIAPNIGFGASKWTQVAFDNNSDIVVTCIKERAHSAVFGSLNSQYFDDVFVWGHSLGCIAALNVAYPSSYSGLILYGGSWELLGKKSEDLMSYPRPALTIMGQRDGFLRYLYLSSVLRQQQETLNSALKVMKVEKERNFIEEKMILHKPIVTMPELNHLHMSKGILPLITRLSGRSDMSSQFTQKEAQLRLGYIVVEFMNVHSHNTTTNKAESKQSILQHCSTTRQSLKSFIDISSRENMTRFIQQSQTQLNNGIPITSKANIIIEWHSSQKDFLYSKPTIWQSGDDVDDGQQSTALVLHVVEQDPISITDAANSQRKNMSTLAPAQIKQISKTLAIKSKSQDMITLLKHQPQKDRDVPVNPLMLLNQQTFDHVLNQIVTEQQRERYFKEGVPLKFGSDVCIDEGPKFVDTPLLLSEHHEPHCYVLQSPYLQTPTTKKPQKFAGMYYYKLLSQAQAYEFIVFDCFK